jgi:hypothetical protein
MPSEIGRGFKFGIGFALGMSLILMFFLFGVSMCAGRLHRDMMERMKEMMPEGRPPDPESGEDSVALSHQRQIFFVKEKRGGLARPGEP